MSLVTVTTSTSALSPKVWGEEGALWARTPLLLQILTLGSWCKHVIVDPEAREITIVVRYLWVLHHRRVVPFADVSHIEYRYGSLATGWNMFGHVHDQVERFTIDLALHDGSEVRVFAFQGEGSVSTGGVGVLLGDSVFDVQGDQQARSLGYIDALQQLTGKGLSKFSRPPRYRPPLAR